MLNVSFSSPTVWVIKKISTTLLLHCLKQKKKQRKNGLFSQYHAQYLEHEQTLIVEELVKETCIHRILFVTIAFDLKIDCNNIRGVIHIGVPHTMEDYCQEGRPGWKRWSLSQGRYLLQLLLNNIPKSEKTCLMK